MAANQQQIDMIVNAIAKGFDKVIDETKKVEKATDDAAETAKKGGLKWTELKSGLDLAMGAYRKVAAVAKAAYEAVSEGAQLNLAADRFDNLTASIGTTSQSMLTDLRAATKGMQSDAQLIAGATDIISLGLADTQEGTVRLATAVSTLGLDMQQVILTFANNSKARLDALGLSIEDVDAKTRELEANGFQGDAFDEAVLIALEEKMTLLGDASLTTAGQMQQLEADWTNLTNSLKQGAAEAVGPLVSDFVKMGDGGDIAAQALEKGLITQMQAFTVQSRLASGGGKDLAEEFAKMGLIIDETGQIIGTMTEDGVKLTAQMEKSAEAATVNAEAIREYSAAAAEARGINEDLSDKTAQLANHTGATEQAVLAANLANKQYFDGLEEGKEALDEMTEAEQEAAEAAKEHAASMGDLFVAAIEGTEGVGLFNETAAELAETTNAATLNQDALSRAIFDSADAQGASAEQLAILGGALGLYSDEAVEAALQTALIQAKIEELTAQYLAGDISVSQMRASVQDFIATINEVPTQHDIVFRITTEGSIPTIPNAPSGGQQAAAFASGTNGWVTVPGPAGAAVPIVVHGGEQMNVIPNGQTGGNGNGRGGVVQNNYFSNPQSPNAIATATAEKLGQLK